MPSLSSHICGGARICAWKFEHRQGSELLKTFVLFLEYIAYRLTTPERGWFRCWFRRPHAVPPRRGLLWPTPARRSRLKCPCGSLRPSVAFAGTWQHTAFQLPSQCTFLPPQTFPWETKKGESERVRRPNNHNHITGFWNIFGQRWFCSVSK